MNKAAKITYYGWSTFSLETENGKLVFDPFCRKFCDVKWSGFDAFKDANVICITHGHAEHYVDVPKILNRSKAVVVGPEEVCRHLEKKYKIDNKRLVPIGPSQTVSVSGYKISAFDWGHREVSFWKLLKLGVLQANLGPILKFGLLNLLKAPHTTTFLGFCVENSNNFKLINFGEGFSDLIDQSKVEALGESFTPDVLLAGIQLNFAPYVAKGAAALLPEKTILFSPHSALFKKCGLKSAPAKTFVDQIREYLPNAQINVADPGSSFSFHK